MNSENKIEANQSNENNKNIKELKNISKEEEIYYVIDHKNNLRLLNSIITNIDNKDRVLSIQKENSLDGESVNQSFVSSNNNSGGNIYKDSNIEKFVSLLTEKLFPKCNLHGFNISKKLSLEYFKVNGGKVDKDKIEKCVNYIYSKKQIITYNNIVTINQEFIRNLGYILMSSYFLFEDYKIMERKDLKLNIKKTLKSNQQVLIDFFNYCKERNHNIDKKRKSQFWEKNSKNYYIPGIFIFLINVFEKVENIEINFEDSNKVFTNEELDFFAISIYNLENIFFNINYVKINLNNKAFQREIYGKYLNDYKEKLQKASNNIKKRILNSETLYNIKWDFKIKFLLNNTKISPELKPAQENQNENTVNIFRSRTTADVNNYFDLRSFNKNKKYEKYNSVIDNDNSSDYEKEEIEYLHNRTTPDMGSNPNNKDIASPLNFIKIILLCVNGLNRFKDLNKMDLILPNSFSEEINYFLKTEILVADNDDTSNNLFISKIKDFHLLDLIFSKFIKLKTINCEFNSLDNATFNSLIKSLYMNNSITTLNLSFFSSDATYLQQSLYKLYNFSYPDEELNMHGDVEKSILEKFLVSFMQNLRNFFDMLRLKNLQNLGINMDIPNIIENNPKYMLIISKFILNIIKYIYRRDITNNPIEKVIIICPKLNLNNEYYPFIDKILSNINKSNMINMKELSFQVQLYKIVHVKNIINVSLSILNIGNCDVVTFESLVDFLTSYRFSSKSNLKKLSLGLVKSVINLNMEIYSLLFQIFNVKITNLLELNIYTNIILNEDKEYIYLLNIFNNNWISKSVFTLNKVSDNIINMKECLDKKNQIKFFVPYSAENECLSPEEKKKMVSIRKNNEIKNDEVYWILKYIFKIRYSCNEMINRNESLSKFLTYNILSYNHFRRNMDIQHYINETN